MLLPLQFGPNALRDTLEVQNYSISELFATATMALINIVGPHFGAHPYKALSLRLVADVSDLETDPEF